MATINQMNLAGTLYDIQDTVSGYLTASSANNLYLTKTGGTLTGILKTSGNDIILGTSSTSSNDSGDLVYSYGNGQEKARIWTNDTYTGAAGLNYRLYNTGGSLLYNGYLAYGIGCPNYSSRANMGLPTNPTSGSTTTYTCPADGWIFVVADRGSGSGYTLYININNVTVTNFPAHHAYYTGQAYLPVRKGDVIKFTTDSSSTTWTVRQQQFYYNR